MSDETHGRVAQHKEAFALPGPWAAPLYGRQHALNILWVEM